MSDGKSGSAALDCWTIEPLSRDVLTTIDRIARTEGVRRVAVLPDVHVAGDFCVGVAVAAEGAVFPRAVGSDIGCGISAFAFEVTAEGFADERFAAAILRDFGRSIPPIRRNRRDAAPPPVGLGPPPSGESRLVAEFNKLVAEQLGTLGRGNHFVELQADESGQLWAMVHSGSRAMGQAINDHYLRFAKATSTGVACLDMATAAGQAYFADQTWARSFAACNRRCIVAALAAVLKARLDADAVAGTFFDVDHNHVAVESHFGENWFVHRKGAAPAARGQSLPLPGSMGTASYHVVGKGLPESLGSAAHGSGRKLSRIQARRQIRHDDLRRQMRGVWFDHRQCAALCEEAPAAYKDIRAVLKAQKELVAVERTLRPILSYKAV